MQDHECKSWSEPQRGYDLCSDSQPVCDSGTLGEADCLAERTISGARISALASDRRRLSLLTAELLSHVDALAQQVRIYQAMAEALEAEHSITAGVYIRAARRALDELHDGKRGVLS